jgi:serine/threonine protein phosphatase PrpC
MYLPSCPRIIPSQPNTGSRILRYGHKFLILASSEFWEIMRNEEAVSIVERNSRRVCLFNLFFLFIQIMIRIIKTNKLSLIPLFICFF